ncbi:MAG: nuclear transport factor 2 family protein [Candidatus Competibacteraceae bacterium]|nr:nuclear transport factor 2 family protein [Candidatus Competibacteraceae bacterium]MBK7985248.1 nuclear transport factor 2 family protein [Candidatus Competibacteraceae bacterium]MBK8895676.1 nuclear transport factor 2 family protein [Candidatus Competibacteraceae bacterium]MBK8962768.1 nuclear transport factor 2 family protein [Candidatus Competibacteraceae bacterium]MBK9953300.1 nuclear transport factor 2 family protein [Candidatus Competibacteraceae bacterium]
MEAFVADWYHKLDIHAPADRLVALVDERVEMQFPEGTVRGAEQFRAWYEGVIRLFFDELHTVTRVGIDWRDDRCLVDVVVNWQARRWRPPAPRSEWIGFDAYQRWEMVPAPSNNSRWVVSRYTVDELRPMPGSPPL